jgi:outer membrane protein OmpU
MKKILLATTILGMSAGFAAAQVSFKGEGKVGFAQNGTKNGGLSGTSMALNGVTNPLPADPTKTIADNQTEFYSTFKLSVSAAGETDSGLTFGASSSFVTGLFYDMGDDDGFEVGKQTLGTPTLFVAGPFGKVQFKTNGFKSLQDDANETYDVDYAGTFGGLSVGIRSDLHTVASNIGYYTNVKSGNPAVAAGNTAGLSSISLGYTISDIKLSAAYDEFGGEWGISASRAFGPVTATVSAAGDEVNATVTTVKVAYAADAISASLAVASDDSWDVAAGYTAAGLTLGVKTNELEEWTATAGYDLGGGLSLEAGANYTDDMFVGAKMAF